MLFTLTLGPCSQEEKIIREFLEVADRFRLNASHLTPDKVESWLTKLEAIFKAAGRTIPVTVDLQGAKMRMGTFLPVQSLPNQVTFRLQRTSKDKTVIPVPHELFFQDLKAGDLIKMNDARILARVTEVRRGQNTAEARATVEENGPLSSFKGVNRSGVPLPYTQISVADRKIIERAIRFKFVEFAFSFAHDGSEAAVLRPLTGDRKLAAKIERPEAMDHLRELDRKFDETWFCRGDLGAQAGLKRLPELQDAYVAAFPKLRQPKHLAGQVLEYMTHFPQPTRSEVVHLHDCRKIGFDGAVFSDETAVGRNPLAVGRFLKLFKA